MKNLLSEYTPKMVETLESQIVAGREEFDGSIETLRSSYRDHLLQRSISGNETRPENWHARNFATGIPYYRSHYYQWMKMMPLRDVERFSRNKLRDREKYPHLVRSRGEKNNMRNNARQGIVPIDVLCRFPTLFHEHDDHKENELKIGADKLAFVFHMDPKGFHAKNGFVDYQFRYAIGENLRATGLLSQILHYSKMFGVEVQMTMQDGYYNEGIECLLGNVNEIVERWWRGNI